MNGDPNVDHDGRPDMIGAQRILDGLDYAAELSEQRDGHRREMRTLLLALLGVRDSFDRLLGGEEAAGHPEPSPEPPEIRSCRLIARQLDAALEAVDVRSMAALGTTVSPDRHDVVDVRTAPPGQADRVLDVVRRGYEWHGELLRPAQVVIGRPDGKDAQ